MLPSVRRKFIGKKNKRLINRFKFRKSTTWRRYNKRKKLKNKRIAKRRKLTRKSRYKKSSAFLLYNKARIQRGESFLFFYRSYINEKGSLNPRSRKDIVEILKKYLDIFSLSTLLLLYNPSSLKNLKGSSIDPQINSFIELIELRLLPFFNIQLYNTESFKKILSTFSVKVQKIFIFVLKYVKKILKIQKITELYEKGYVGERDFVKLIGELNKKVINKRKEDNIMIGSMAEGKRTTIKKIKGKLKSALYPVKKKKRKEKR